MTNGTPATAEYCPRDILGDETLLGLVSSRVDTALGPVAVRHRAQRRMPVAVVFLHGAAGSWSTWSPLLATARAQAVELPDVIALDLPGWGDSPLPHDDDALTLDAIAEVIRGICEGLGYTRWHVVGHSMGGFIALHLAALWPQRVLSATLVSGTVLAVSTTVAHPVRRFGVIPWFAMLLGIMRLLARLDSAGRALVLAADRAGLMRPAMWPLFRHGLRVRRSVLHALAVEVRPRSFVLATSLAEGYELRRAREVRCPVTLSRGRRDSFVPSAELRALRRMIPQARVVEIADCGHFSHIEHPARALELITGAIAAAR
ncbi:alpha/beta fold hydrolase [Compostimonas suwonensis]|uniref:Pimeloyl-ACP methyl ester carboxylesterase n=1 Tax=Compostimonas suwonensis TaxID=1048394 RepID=A0A2M9BZ89_9MICO|nr:alpha/beta hydrolase [Compostimonas suwonensis]PJJ63398.1 pimeloyl-ACP methyl ester carboxylesterase [Compostimonas suwonensis]